MTTREHLYIKRHDIFKRLTHAAFSVGGVLLALSGLLLFIPGLAEAVGANVLFFSTTFHRVVAVLFIGVPIICAIIRPSNVKHTFQHLFRKWDADDKEFMRLFPKYLFNPKKYHMPKQHFVKSGQRISDIAMYIIIIFIAITGIVLWFGEPYLPAQVLSLALFGHDLCFFGLSLIFVLHVYLGGGIFQPYRRSARLMFRDGLVSESDALYHWAYWAERELEENKDIVKES